MKVSQKFCIFEESNLNQSIMETIEEALKSFINNEDVDEGNEQLRARIKSLKELRYALAVASTDHSEDVTLTNSNLYDCGLSGKLRNRQG